ncbi:MAG: fumarylacetoacetate hydrolase family protein [Candidatus Omnitrophota bacterium]
MKLIRFLTIDDKTEWGILDSEYEDDAYVIEGNIFDKFSISTHLVRIKRFLSPVVPPDIIGIGLNYQKHAAETGIKIPDIPVMFIKAHGALVGHEDPIALPKAGPFEVDCEAELAVVIGKTAKNVSRESAMDHVLGYTCANDVSARDWQTRKQKTQWTRGKSFDTFCPVGPWIVTKDEIPDPHGLAIQLDINGQAIQDSNTSDMIFDIPTIVSNLSQSMTLFAGTVILTGTPHGVGYTRIPPSYLRTGDTVTVYIEKIGRLVNPVVMER